MTISLPLLRAGDLVSMKRMILAFVLCSFAQGCGQESQTKNQGDMHAVVFFEANNGYAIRPNLADSVAPFALDVRYATQEGVNWCWAASGSMIMNFERPKDSLVQCELANTRWPGKKCCVAYACDWPGYPDFRAFGFDSQCRKSPLSFESIRSELQGKHPIAFSWRETDSSEHMMVIYGYKIADGKWVIVNDPLGQEKYVEYDAYNGRRGGRAHGRDYYRIIDKGAPPNNVPRAPPDKCEESLGAFVINSGLAATPDIVQGALGVDSGRYDAANSLATELLKLEEHTPDRSPQTLFTPPGMKRLETSDTLSAPVLYSRLDSLARYRAETTPIMHVLEPTSERAYAILNGTTVVATGKIIRGKAGMWYPASIGPPDLARAMSSVRRAENGNADRTSRAELIVVRTPPAIGAEFGGRWKNGSLWLTPARPMEAFGWVSGDAILADSVFSKLSHIAQGILAGPRDQ